jgi:glucokinase
MQLRLSLVCIAAAGVVSEKRDWVKPTNLPIEIHTRAISERTGIECVFLVNDFEVIGYGLSSISKKDLFHVHEGKKREKANQAILGAGTGLGKCIMI